MDEQPKQTKRRKGRKLVLFLVLLLIAALAGCGFLYWQYAKASDKDPVVQQQRWTAELRAVALVPDDDPVITTVLDKDKLTNKSLADRAQNGDRLYIYGQAKRLVLYRPSTKQVVDMLTIQSQQ